jgi:hypothetical protein
VAALTSAEFARAIQVLADEMGLQRLGDRLVRLNALVTRRRIPSASALSEQLFALTAGLRRQIPATFAFQSLWSETVNTKLGKEGEKKAEELAEAINACLDERSQILPDKLSELDSALATYQLMLTEALGGEIARLDMLLKSVPAIAAKLREV